jgi:S-adenosylmethionine:tRNA ribosyltransferase-isomerase
MPGGRQALVLTDSQHGVLRVQPLQPIDEDYFERFGLVPIPPYLGRPAEELDAERYQTIYARDPGSVAAPTAGLHLTDALVERLRAKGMTVADLTLHVGLGTFAPVRTDRAEDHAMHSERYCIPEELARLITERKRSGAGVVAIGTTVVRALEAAMKDGIPGSREWRSTDLFITPGYEFQIVKALFTNFHTPRSTLMMLVSAFAGRDLVMEAYEHAIREQYRFFSYGDACLFLP